MPFTGKIKIDALCLTPQPLLSDINVYNLYTRYMLKGGDIRVQDVLELCWSK